MDMAKIIKRTTFVLLAVFLSYTAYSQTNDKLSADELYNKAEQWYELKQYDKAEECYWLAYEKGIEDAIIDMFWCGYESSNCETIDKSLRYACMNPYNSEATFIHAFAQYNGICMKRNESMAIKEMEKAADEDNVNALKFLADLYKEKGDTLKALEYYKIAAKWADAESLYVLGDYYEKLKDYNQAFVYFLFAANFNYTPAYKRLALYHYFGWGHVPQDTERAKGLLKIAIDDGDEEAIPMLNGIIELENSSGVETKVNEVADSSKILSDWGDWCFSKENYVQAKAYYIRAKDFGNKDAGFMIFLCDYNMNDCESAVKSIKEIVDKEENGEAEYTYGIMLYNGECVKKNVGEAVKYMEKAAKRDYVEAINFLGDRYRIGDVIAADSAKALSYYKQSAELGDGVGLFNVGVCYASGIGTKVDKKKAVEYYYEAIKEGIAQAYNNLAIMHFLGDGVEENYELAKRLLKIAAYLGNENSIELMRVFGIE